MDEDYKIGVTIKGEFHPIKINESPTEIFSTDPPYVGHTQQTRKVSFTEYSDGQLVILLERWGNYVQEIKKVGEIPDNLLNEIIKKIP